MGRQMGELQRELQTLREREDERDFRNDQSLEAIEALIGEAGEESARLINVQAEANSRAIDTVRSDIRGGYSRVSGFIFQVLRAQSGELRETDIYTFRRRFSNAAVVL